MADEINNDEIAELMRRRDCAEAMALICEGTVPIAMVFKAQSIAYEDAIGILEARHAARSRTPA